MKFPSTSNTSVQRCLFQGDQDQDQQIVNKHNADYHSSSSQLISRIHSLIFIWTLISIWIIYIYIWYIGSKIFLEFFPKPIYSIMVAEKFGIYSVKKNESVRFYSSPHQNYPLGFDHHYPPPPRLRQLPILPNNVFWISYFFPLEGWEDYVVEKIIKIKQF